MNKPAFSLLFALLLGATPLAHAALPSPPPANLQHIESLQRRADKLAFDLLDPNNYHLAKARAWLNLATSEYYEKDTSGALEAAIDQAKTLLDALENRQTGIGPTGIGPAAINMDTPLQLPGSDAVRPDLLGKIAALKKHEKFSCGQRPSAEAEVYLLWAGHEFHEYGTSHAESYLRGVENLIYEAQVAIDNCVSAPAVVQAPPLDKITLSGDALFAFNKATLNPEALWRLDNLAVNIKQVDQLEEVVLVGHTDRYGNFEHNQKLSEQRAESIKQYLAGKGIPEDKIHTQGAGSSQPLVQCPDNQSKTKQVACLQPNRRVEIILRGVKDGSKVQPPAAADGAGQPPAK